jgi:transcriptional regulator with XRE-family HTH domain
MLDKIDSLGSSLRRIRESKGLLLRQVAAALQVDTAFVSKFERGERGVTKDQVQKLARFLDTSEDKLLELWLADKLMDTLEGEEHGENALKIVTKRIKNK